MKHSNFMIDEAVIRRWNNQLYYICHDIDNDKCEFMVDKVKGQKLSKCKVAECYMNLRLATEDEISRGYAEVF